MGRHESEDALEGTQPQRDVMGNGEMEFPVETGGQADVRPVLTGAFITQGPQRFDQFRTRDIPGSLYATSTSSRTK